MFIFSNCLAGPLVDKLFGGGGDLSLWNIENLISETEETKKKKIDFSQGQQLTIIHGAKDGRSILA